MQNMGITNVINEQYYDNVRDEIKYDSINSTRSYILEAHPQYFATRTSLVSG